MYITVPCHNIGTRHSALEAARKRFSGSKRKNKDRVSLKANHRFDGRCRVCRVCRVSHRATEVINSVASFYKVKEGSDKPPEIYLCANIKKNQTPDGAEIWSQSSKNYVKNSVQVAEDLLEEDGGGYTLKNGVKNPLPTGYELELNITDELGDKLASRYLQLIGICRWAIELGRIEIFLEVSLLSAYQASPRIGHLKTLYYVLHT